MIRRVSCAVGVAALLAGASCDSSSPTAPTNCSQLTVAPSTVAVGGDAGTAALTVGAPPGCSWSASSASGWITITAGSSGSGAGTVTVSYTANPTGNARSGTLQVAQRPVGVNQAGAAPGPGCTYQIRPTARSVGAGGGGFLVMVNALFGCKWGFASNTPWLVLMPEGEGAPNGNGNGSIEAQVSPNPGAAPRTGTAVVAGETLTVTQDGTSSAACAYAIAPAAVQVIAAGGTPTVGIDTGPFCSWSLEPDVYGEDWIRVGSVVRGSGPATVAYTVTPNTTFVARSGGMVVHGDSGQARLTQRVTQSAASCVYQVSPPETRVSALGTTGPITISVVATPADCSWEASSGAAWAPIQGGWRGTGSAELRFRVDPNPGAARSTAITISGLSGVNPSARHVITQNAAGTLR